MGYNTSRAWNIYYTDLIHKWTDVVYPKLVNLQLYEDISHQDCLTPVITSLLGLWFLYVLIFSYFPILVYIEIGSGTLCNYLTDLNNFDRNNKISLIRKLWEKWWSIIYKNNTHQIYDYHHTWIYNNKKCTFYCSILHKW